MPAALLARSAFPEREDKPVHLADRWALGVLARWRRLRLGTAGRDVARLERRLAAELPGLAALDDAALRQRLRAAARTAVKGGATAAVDAALLLVAEASRRSLGLTPHATQLAGAATLLRGRLAEMATGEGKTLTAGLAACLAGCAGVPVHVITVNDYLAERDAAKIGPLYAFAGLSVGSVLSGQPPERHRAAYACDVAYCTGKELVFDYLRDRVAARGRASAAQLAARAVVGGTAPPPLLRGLHFAIVDEADSIMIDEARTPLILAEKAGAVDHVEALPLALRVAGGLAEGEDYLLDAGRRDIRLTARGRERLAALAGQGGPFGAGHAREHLILQALRALRLFHRDRQYLIDADGKVQIIDEYTGRVLAGRVWEQGLHQLIETKEGVALSERTRTLARITYQRFFCRYLLLGGMTGTAREMAREMAVVYRLDTVTLPTHRPGRRRQLPERVFADPAARWEAVAELTARLHAGGQPVLIGTRSVAGSEQLSAVLERHGVPHAVLNARQDAEEAAIVARAGQPGAVTVATNMAGRGTDIELGEGVEALGGLFVVLTEYHESPRIDRQLVGRCGRQGQPGQCQAITCLADELLQQHGGLGRRALGGLTRRAETGPLLRWLARRVRLSAQARAERIHARTRRDTLQQDRELERSMGFSGDPT